MAPWDLQDEEIPLAIIIWQWKKTNQLRQLSYLVRGFPGSSLRTRGELGESEKSHHCWVPETDLGEMFDPQKNRGIWNDWTVFWICTVCWCFMCLDYGTKRVYLFGPTSVTTFDTIYNSFIGVYNADRYQLEGHDQSSNQPWGFSPRSKIEPVNNWCILIHVNGNGTYSITPPNDMG